MELQSRYEKSLHYWIHMSALLGPYHGSRVQYGVRYDIC
jgi:hypothetical protein